MKKLTFLMTLAFFFYSCISTLIMAQSTIKGVAKKIDGNPLSNANIMLFSAIDSSFVKGEVTGDDGSFQFQNINVGSYWINISRSGFKDQGLTNVNIDRENSVINLAEVILQKETHELDSYTPVLKKAITLKHLKPIFADH
jgi:hypothetical protein